MSVDVKNNEINSQWTGSRRIGEIRKIECRACRQEHNYFISEDNCPVCKNCGGEIKIMRKGG